MLLAVLVQPMGWHEGLRRRLRMYKTVLLMLLHAMHLGRSQLQRLKLLLLLRWLRDEPFTRWHLRLRH